MQLEMFANPKTVTDENLDIWVGEVGEKTPIGQFLILIQQQAPCGLLALLDYRAGGQTSAEDASELINLVNDWMKELAIYNMAQLEDEIDG